MNSVSIIYRACGKEQKIEEFNQSRLNWFNKNKCFKSLYNSFGGKADIYLVWDGDRNNYLFRYITSFDIKEVFSPEKTGNEESLLFCYDLMGKIDSEFLFLTEDDYLYLSNSYEVLMDGLEKFKSAGTVSLYNHPDRVRRKDDITLGQEYILEGKYCYWRTAESNTATFAISKNLFLKHQDEFINCSIHDRLLFINLLKKYNLRHFTPISEKYGSSHVNKFFNSLYIDWEFYNGNIIL